MKELTCFELFIALAAIAFVLFVAASMLSSIISREEEDNGKYL